MSPLLSTIISESPAPSVDLDGPFQMQISSLGYDPYIGVLGTGKIQRGEIKSNTPIAISSEGRTNNNARIMDLFGFDGLKRVKIESAHAGDIITISGIENLSISDTLCNRDHIESLPPLKVDEPTISMTFQVNKSPFSGKDGKYLTSRQIRERLDTELTHNVALRVEDTSDPDKFRVSGLSLIHI